MTNAEPHIIVSDLSRTITIDGVSVDVQIYRLEDDPNWILEVVSDSGMSSIWDECFATEAAALAAFQAVVQEEGIGTFLDDKGTETLH